MPGKRRDYKYVEMRNAVAGVSGGGAQLKAEIIPALMAWLIMLSNRYTKCANAMKDRYVSNTVPQLKASAERMEWAAEHLIWLAKELPMRFRREDYRVAAEQVSAAIGLLPGQVPGWDLAWEEGYKLFPMVDDAGNEGGGAGTVRPGVAPGEVGEGRLGEPAAGGPAGAGGPDSPGVSPAPPDRDGGKRPRRTQRRAKSNQQPGGGSGAGK